MDYWNKWPANDSSPYQCNPHYCKTLINSTNIVYESSFGGENAPETIGPIKINMLIMLRFQNRITLDTLVIGRTCAIKGIRISILQLELV